MDKAILHPGSVIIGRLPQGVDLLDGLMAVCRENGISMAHLSALGAMQRATIGYYNQTSRCYEYINIDEPVELLDLVGNASLRDNSVVIHAHVTLADRSGKALGGHLAPGTIVFACEYTITSLEGEPLKRTHDAQTGLHLWHKNQ